MSHLNPIIKRKRKGLVLAIVGGIIGTFLLSGAMTPAFSNFTASINNSTNTVGSGTLLLSENQGATTCLSSAAGTVTVANAGTCATINKFGGNLVSAPGGTPAVQTVTIKNNGTLPANTFTLTPAGCAQAANGAVNGTATDFCSKVNLTIADTTGTAACVFPAGAGACPAISNTNTLTTLGTTPIALTSPLAPGATRSFTFTVQIDGGSTNAYQGLQASDALLWSIAS